MSKWSLFTASTILAIFAFINYALISSCETIAQPIPNNFQKGCSSFLETSFLLLAFTAAALFLAFVLAEDHSKKHHRNR